MFSLMLLEWPFVTIAAAFLASLGFFNIFIVMILGWLGDTIGDVILFCVGRYGIKFFEKKATKLKATKLTEEKSENILTKFDALIEKNFFLALIFIKFIPYAPMIALPYLGRTPTKMRKFVLCTAILSLPVPLGAALIGFNITFFWNIFANLSHNEKIIFGSIGIIILIILFFLGKFVYQKYKPLILQKFNDYVEK